MVQRTHGLKMESLVIYRHVLITPRFNPLSWFLMDRKQITQTRDFLTEKDRGKLFPEELDIENWEKVLVAFNEALQGKAPTEKQITIYNGPVTFHFVVSKIPEDAEIKSTILCDLIYTTMRLVLYEYDPKKLTLASAEDTVFFRNEYFKSIKILIQLLINVKDGSISDKSAEKINEMLRTCINHEAKNTKDKISNFLAMIVQRFIILFVEPGFEKKFESYWLVG